MTNMKFQFQQQTISTFQQTFQHLDFRVTYISRGKHLNRGRFLNRTIKKGKDQKRFRTVVALHIAVFAPLQCGKLMEITQKDQSHL